MNPEEIPALEPDVLQNGETVSYGPVDEALSGEHLREAYGMDVRGWMRKLMKERE